MKQFLIAVLCFTTVVNAVAQTKGKAKAPVKTLSKPTFQNSTDSFSYAVGVSIANNMMQQGITSINFAYLQKGMNASFKNEKKLMDENQCNMSIQAKLQEFAGKKSEAEKLKCKTYLEANAKRKEVVSLPNGLQYEVLKAAPDSSVLKPAPSDTVVVNYVGTLIDGTEFDNSYKRGNPATFPLNGVIRGWTEILQLMRVGDRWRVYIPTELAYGMNPPTPAIPAGAALVFDISLEGINPAAIK